MLTDDEADDASRTANGPSAVHHEQRLAPQTQGRGSAQQDNATLFLNLAVVSDDVCGVVVEHKPIPDNLSTEC